MLDKVTHNITVGGGAVAVLGGLSLNQYLAIGGFIIAALSFAVNAYSVYRKHKHYKHIEARLQRHLDDK